MILEVKDLRVYYDDVILAVDNINIVVEKQEIVSLLGPNGAGKSSCLKAISGLLGMENGKIARGEIFFDGNKVDHLSPFERVRLGISLVAEGREIFNTLTVVENLKAGTLIRKDSPEIVNKDFEQVYTFFPVLKAREKQVSGTLSGGEQQMMVIARSLMLKPRLLLLDEPSLGLAPIVAHEVIRQIQRINEELATTILLVEQNASLALPLSKRIYIINNGQVVFTSSSEEIQNIQDISQYYLGKRRIED